jgi:hypothetical protein
MSFLDRLVALDIWLMRHVFGGLPGETLSSAAFNAHLTGHAWWGWTYRVIDALFFVLIGQRNHCADDWRYRSHIYQEDVSHG